MSKRNYEFYYKRKAMKEKYSKSKINWERLFEIFLFYPSILFLFLLWSSTYFVKLF